MTDSQLQKGLITLFNQHFRKRIKKLDVYLAGHTKHRAEQYIQSSYEPDLKARGREYH